MALVELIVQVALVELIDQTVPVILTRQAIKSNSLLASCELLAVSWGENRLGEQRGSLMLASAADWLGTSCGGCVAAVGRTQQYPVCHGGEHTLTPSSRAFQPLITTRV